MSMKFRTHRTRTVLLLALLMLFQSAWVGAEASVVDPCLESFPVTVGDNALCDQAECDRLCIAEVVPSDDVVHTTTQTPDCCDNCCHAHGPHLTLLSEVGLSNPDGASLAPAIFRIGSIAKHPASIDRPPLA